MPTIKRECIDRIKEIADLYDIVSAHVQLKRSGSNWKGLSPFTEEKTASFFVLPEKKFFKCFSTGYAGDIFRFLELKENFSFVESVEWLSKYYNIQLEYEGKSHAEYSKNELFDIHENALNYYRKNFSNNKNAKHYWVEVRKFSLDTAEKYGIGWAPGVDNGLISLLRKKNYTTEALRKCGLLFFNENNRNDFRVKFSNRLMIPIYDVQNRVIGFSGRAIEKKDDVAKYINSPETPIFHKGNILYGLNHARKFATDGFILVEGQLDVLRCWENGLHEAVAPQGTGITESQLNLLRRYTSKILCLTDGDIAGQKCAQRVAELSFKVGVECKIATLNIGDDPDLLLLRDGKSGFENINQETTIQFLSRVLLPRKSESTAIEKEIFLKKMYDMISSCDSEVTCNIYLTELANHIDLDKIAVINDFKNFCGDMKFSKNTAIVKQENSKQNIKFISEKLRSAEYDLLSIILHHVEIGEKIAKIIDELWIMDSKYGKLLIEILKKIKEGKWKGLQGNDETFSQEEVNELFSILATDDIVEEPIYSANMCLKAICGTFSKKKLNELNQKEMEYRKFTKNKNLLDERDFFKKLQEEKLHFRNLLLFCPKIEM